MDPSGTFANGMDQVVYEIVVGVVLRLEYYFHYSFDQLYLNW